MGFLSWLTGRDEKESDVYANYDKVSTVVSDLTTIASTKVSNAQTEVNAALQELNSVNGLAEYMGFEVPAGYYDGIFTSTADTIKQIGSQIQKKSDDIKAYEESAWYEKVGSTFAMGAAKFGEGILSVVEDLGDGIVSLVGWIAPKDSGLEKACSDFVKKEWSHDAFNFYYNSDFAKKSAFTEDSALASGFKIVGKTVGTLYGAGVFAGATGLSALSAGTGFMQLSGTTISAATIAGVSGLGSGTETGLLKGKDINQAFTSDGLVSGAIGAGLAIAGGRIGEKMSFKAMGAGKGGANYEAVTDATNKARQTWKEIATNKGLSGLGKTEAYKALGSELQSTLSGIDGVDLTKLGNYAMKADEAGVETLQRVGGVGVQGYTDSITNAGVRFGEAGREYVQSSAAIFAANRATKASDKAAAAGKKAGEAKEATEGTKGLKKATSEAKAKGASKKAASADKASAKAAGKAEKLTNGHSVEELQTMKDNARSALRVDNPLSQAGRTISSGAKSIGNAVTHPGETLKNAGEGIRNAVTHPIKTASSVLTNPALPGVAGVAAGSAINVSTNDAASQAAKARPPQGDTADQVFDQDTTPSDTDDNNNNNNNENNNNNNNNENNNNNNNNNNGNNNNGGGNYSGGGGGGGGGYSGGDGGPQYKKEIPTSAPTTPGTVAPTTGAPTTGAPTTGAPTTGAPATGAPATGAPATGAPSGGGGTYTDGGSYSPGGDNGGGYYTGGGTYSQPAEQSYTGGGEYGEEGFVSDGTEDLEPLDESLLSGATSIDDIIRNNSVTKVKTNAPITTKGKSSGASAVIPIAAGLSAAAAAGIGAKAYMDSRNNNDMDEEDDEMEDGEWSEEYGDGQYEADMGDAYLDDEEYGFQATDLGYSARSSEELAELQ